MEQAQPTSVSLYPLLWKPVDPSRVEQELAGWPEIHPILQDRIARFKAALKIDGHTEVMSEFLEELRKGFEQRFQPSRFEHTLALDGNVEIKRQLLHAIKELSNEFGDLIPSILWNSYIAQATRKNPHSEKSILEIQDELPHPWYISDAANHAMRKSDRLGLYVQSKVNEHTGSIMIHGCGCSHVVPNLAQGKIVIRYPLPKSQFVQAAQEFLDHMMSEAVSMVVLGYPFRLNPEDLGSMQILTLRPSSPSQ